MVVLPVSVNTIARGLEDIGLLQYSRALGPKSSHMPQIDFGQRQLGSKVMSILQH